jgi:hypothetical protein
MADYYPLLKRAVAALPNSTPAARQSIYERAKKALLGQLTAMQPPPPAGAIEREAQALDEAVARIERELSEAAEAEAVKSAAAAVKPAADSVKSATPAVEPEAPAVEPAAAEAPRAEEDGAPAESLAGDEAAAQEPQPRRDEAPGRDRLRPAAPRPAQPKSGGLRRLAIIVGALVFVAALVGVAAWKLRDRPEDLARLSPPADKTQESGGKIGERIGGEGVAQPAQKPVQPLPIAYRAAVLTRDASVPGGVKTYVGTVVWRRESTNRGPNQQLVSAIRADVDVPDAKLKASVVIEKNFDPSLSFSHTINVRFFPAEGAPLGSITAIGMPEMRSDEAPKGVPLQGLPVPVAPNAFLAGLNQASVDENRALLEGPNWMDIQMSLANGSIAKITVEKGAGGRKIFSEVFAEWNGK